MRALHIVGDSKWGGGSLVILALAEAGRRAGWTVDILTTDPVTIAAARERGLGVVALDVIRRAVRPVSDLRGLWRLRRFLREAGYDLVHTHTSKAGFIGRIAAALAGAPAIVHTMHGFAIHEDSPAAERIAYAALEKFAAYCCDRIITVSHFHRRWALDLGIAPASKLTAIPNGVPDAAPAAGRAETRRKLGLADADVAILSNSRLAPQKGLEDLLRAAARLEQVTFLLAGDGPLRPALERVASRNVRFLGFRPDMPDLLAAADIVALASLREGLSIALLEAMAAARPVVATTIGSIREATADGECAILVPPRDPVALAAAIAQLISDPARAARLGQRGREIYLERYTLDRMTSRYLLLYEEVLREKEPAFREAPRVAAGVRD